MASSSSNAAPKGLLEQGLVLFTTLSESDRAKVLDAISATSPPGSPSTRAYNVEGGSDSIALAYVPGTRSIDAATIATLAQLLAPVFSVVIQMVGSYLKTKIDPAIVDIATGAANDAVQTTRCCGIFSSSSSSSPAPAASSSSSSSVPRQARK